MDKWRKFWKGPTYAIVLPPLELETPHLAGYAVALVGVYRIQHHRRRCRPMRFPCTHMPHLTDQCSTTQIREVEVCENGDQQFRWKVRFFSRFEPWTKDASAFTNTTQGNSVYDEKLGRW
jgi:hypothetical protein